MAIDGPIIASYLAAKSQLEATPMKAPSINPAQSITQTMKPRHCP